MGDEDPGSDRGDRMDVRREVAEVDALGFTEQEQRGIKIAIRLRHPRTYDPRPVRFAR